MPQSIECEIREGGRWKAINIIEVFEIPKLDREIRCVKCQEPVRAHRRGKRGSPAAHFEHLGGNRKCPLRQKGRDN
jgi:hypothetical protein